MVLVTVYDCQLNISKGICGVKGGREGNCLSSSSSRNVISYSVYCQYYTYSGMRFGAASLSNSNRFGNLRLSPPYPHPNLELLGKKKKKKILLM